MFENPDEYEEMLQVANGEGKMQFSYTIIARESY